MFLSPDSSVLRMSGADHLEAEPGEWWLPLRLPGRVLTVIGNADMARTAKFASGVRFAFTTDAATLAIRIDGAEESSPLDLVIDEALQARREIAPGAQVLTFDLPPGLHEVEIWLPQFGENRVGMLELPDSAVVAAPRMAEVNWVAYGSSITQCRTAEGPSETWPALVARTLNWQLTNLGFGGQCHLDPAIARYMRDLPDVDLFSLCVGINIYGQASFNQRTLQSAICGFVDTIREKYPDTPITLMTPISAPTFEMEPNAVGLTLGHVREIVATSGEALARLGDPNLTVISGPEIFGPDDSDLLADLLHPTADGYRRIAQRLTPVLSARVAT